MTLTHAALTVVEHAHENRAEFDACLEQLAGVASRLTRAYA